MGSTAHQNCSRYYQCSPPVEAVWAEGDEEAWRALGWDGALGGIRSWDGAESYLLSLPLPQPVPGWNGGAGVMDGWCFNSLPAVVKLPELEVGDLEWVTQVEDEEFSGGGDAWMDWLAQDLWDCETGWSPGLEDCNPCDSSESSEMASPQATVSGGEEDFGQGERGPDLVKLLFRCAKFVEEEDHHNAARALSDLLQLSSPLGDFTQRVVCYFAQALSERLAEEAPQVETLEAGELAVACRALNEICPCSTFAYLTANQAILESVENAEKIHIVDFGIGQGVQWAPLLQALASRLPGKPRKVKISALPSEKSSQHSSLVATGRRLTEFALVLGLDFEFNPVLKPLKELNNDEDPSIFNVEEDKECVAVNFMHRLCDLTDERTVGRALKLAHSLKPKVVTVAEHKLGFKGCGFQNAFRYFSSVFESLEGKMSRDCVERQWAEKLVFAETIRKVGCLRPEWRPKMESAGFKRCNASQYTLSQARTLLWNYNDKFRAVDSRDGVSLAWEDWPLVTVSSWTC
uniref:TSA: Wollemia nobilis Ref_Wollemi_Transcript_13484_2210 transcribed RNA sequence n=1 Tax=Wollemia nobilis TaxID=56998 RepID=A0A0C9RKN4_9CONI